YPLLLLSLFSCLGGTQTQLVFAPSRRVPGLTDPSWNRGQATASLARCSSLSWQHRPVEISSSPRPIPRRQSNVGHFRPRQSRRGSPPSEMLRPSCSDNL